MVPFQEGTQKAIPGQEAGMGTFQALWAKRSIPTLLRLTLRSCPQTLCQQPPCYGQIALCRRLIRGQR